MLYGNIEQLTLLPYVNNIIKKLIIEAVKIAEDQPAGRYELSFPESFLMIS
ncbi:YhcH/YjgK/YiaL family protein, partial [Salmonella enterica]|nr:YhcH/YjgK/YiaL family protein [Salmonella enterica]